MNEIPLHTPLSSPRAGELPGAAATRHQVRTINLVLETLPDGRLRVSTPLARGWAAVASNQGELVRAVQAAFTEVQLASYARWKGETYELDEMTEVVADDPLAAPTRTMHFSNRMVRSDIHHPADWQPLSDGTWRSPKGRIYQADSQAVQRVRAKLHLLGEMGIVPPFQQG